MIDDEFLMQVIKDNNGTEDNFDLDVVRLAGVGMAIMDDNAHPMKKEYREYVRDVIITSIKRIQRDKPKKKEKHHGD